MKKGKIALTTVYFLRYCMTGTMWILYGILNFFDEHSMPLKIVSTICMAVAIIFTLASLFVKQEIEDDASHLHMMKACTVTLFAVLFVVMAISIMSAFVPESMFDFNLLYPFIIGLILLLVGGVFIYCEKWGDDIWEK